MVLCSPLTLYAFLGVVRQATDSFHTEQNAADIMRRINLFNKEWAKYTEAVESVEEQFKKMVSAIESINVDGTRFKKLNVQVREIEKIRKREGIAEITADEAGALDSIQLSSSRYGSLSTSMRRPPPDGGESPGQGPGSVRPGVSCGFGS